MVGAASVSMADDGTETTEDHPDHPLLAWLCVRLPSFSLLGLHETTHRFRCSNTFLRSVAFISIIRVIFLEDLKRNQDPDFTWVGARFGFLSIIELNAAITVASIITLKPLADRLIPSLLQTASLEELPGEAPPTIGTRPVPPSAGHSSRDRSKNDSDLEEAWELARTDFESYRVASTSTSHR